MTPIAPSSRHPTCLQAHFREGNNAANLAASASGQSFPQGTARLCLRISKADNSTPRPHKQPREEKGPNTQLGFRLHVQQRARRTQSALEAKGPCRPS